LLDLSKAVRLGKIMRLPKPITNLTANACPLSSIDDRVRRNRTILALFWFSADVGKVAVISGMPGSTA
jgi:hypothetical protein